MNVSSQSPLLLVICAVFWPARVSGPIQPSGKGGKMLQDKFQVSGSKFNVGLELELETWNAELETVNLPGTWTAESVAGHPCDIYLPPQRNQHGYVALYLHGVHLDGLDDKPA